MPLIVRDRSVLQVAHASTMRSTNELVEQLQAQLQKEREQHRFNMAQKESEVAMLLREVAGLRLELGPRDRMEAFAAAQSPSPSRH